MKAALFKARHIAGKAVRRLRSVVGKPDPAPWVLLPRAQRVAPKYVDFIFGLDYINNNSRLTQLMQQAMAPYGLSMLLVNKDNVSAVSRDVDRGLVRPHVYLDLCARPNSPFWDLLYKFADKGVHTLRKPEHDAWTRKANSHVKLQAAGLPLPPTVIFRKDDPDRELTSEERRLVGDRCVIKPSWGEAARGVVANVKPTLENICKARDFRREDDWLVQKMVNWGRLGNRQAYVRAYNVLGHRSVLWWAMHHDSYAQVTWDEMYRYDLMPVLDIINRIAQVSGVEFFSTEIAITNNTGLDRFALIDYINDACDLDPHAAGTAPPEPWVKWVCERFAEYTWRKKMNLGNGENTSVFLGAPEAGKLLSGLQSGASASNAA